MGTFLAAGPGVLLHGPRDRREIALTFDADMTPRMLCELRAGRVKSWYDSRVVAILKDQQVSATFFISGLWAQAYPQIVRELSRNPLFEVESHGFSHAAFRSPCYHLPLALDRAAEIADAQAVLRNLTGSPPRFFRFPGGCFSPQDITLARSYGLQVIGWDVNSGDAFSANARAIVETVLAKATNGSIVVMYPSGAPNAPETASALPSIIRGLRAHGFAFVTVARLLGPRSRHPLSTAGGGGRPISTLC